MHSEQFDTRFWQKMVISLDEYDDKLAATNKSLAELVEGNPQSSFWHHHEFWKSSVNPICNDGVHLSDKL